MWEYKQFKASGKDSRGVQEAPPLYKDQFLPFKKVNMGHYLTTPMLTTLKAPQVPEGLSNLAKEKVKSPSYFSVPYKQFCAQERAMREVVQVLEHVVYFKSAAAVISDRIRSFMEDAKRSVGPRDLLERALSNQLMEARIMSSIETALETVLNQCMTMVCNSTLLHRDSLLRRCGNISSEDLSLLRNAPFTDSELFPTEAINRAENNMLKRSATHSASTTSHSAAKKPKRSTDDFLPFETSSRSNSSSRGTTHNQSRGSFRGGRKSHNNKGYQQSSKAGSFQPRK